MNNRNARKYDYMGEDLADMVLAFGEVRAKTCLYRLDKLMDIDTTGIDKINRQNWLPISIYSLDTAKLDKDKNIIRLSNIRSIKNRMIMLTEEEFVLTNPNEKGDF